MSAFPRSPLCFSPLISFRIKLLPAGRPSCHCSGPSRRRQEVSAPATNPQHQDTLTYQHQYHQFYPLRTLFRVQSSDADSAFSLNQSDPSWQNYERNVILSLFLSRSLVLRMMFSTNWFFSIFLTVKTAAKFPRWRMKAWGFLFIYYHHHHHHWIKVSGAVMIPLSRLH